MLHNFLSSFESPYIYLKDYFSEDDINSSEVIETEELLTKSNNIILKNNNSIEGLLLYQESAFDSEILGLKYAKISKVLAKDYASKEKVLSLFNEKARHEGIKYAVTRFPADFQWAEAFEKNGYSIVDSILYLHKKIESSDIKNTSDFRIRTANDNDRETIGDIANRSFTFGRFYNDRLIDSEKAGKIYQSWVENSIERKVCDDMLVVENEEKDVLGFVTVKKIKLKNVPHDSLGSIELLAVDEKYRGKGIGKALIRAAFNYFYANKTYIILIDTQTTNIPALRIYTSMGFKPGKNYFTYRIIL